MKTLIFVAAILAVVLYITIIIIPIALTTKAACLEKGYSTSTVSFFLGRYCKTTFRGTDLVIPLSKAPILHPSGASLQ